MKIISFDAYEVHGCRDYGDHVEQVPDTEAHFWSLYGHVMGQGLFCIGDYDSREHAEEMRQRITGDLPKIK